MMRRIGMAAALFIGGLAIWGSQACQSVTNATAVQCINEAECRAKGPEFANTTCDTVTRTCVPLPTSNPDACKTNAECISRAGGAPAICRKTDNTCVNVQTAECPNFIDI